ncbi:MAG TPA: hypothetical protein DCR20_01325 [Planctomycetaceae bacterium]|nr:hypothetical protein [Planctomycetaceae bacterium]
MSSVFRCDYREWCRVMSDLRGCGEKATSIGVDLSGDWSVTGAEGMLLVGNRAVAACLAVTGPVGN